MREGRQQRIIFQNGFVTLLREFVSIAVSGNLPSYLSFWTNQSIKKTINQNPSHNAIQVLKETELFLNTFCNEELTSYWNNLNTDYFQMLELP